MSTPSSTAPALSGPVLFRQEWLDVTFLHWALEAALVAPVLPAGTRPDTFDGLTYVALVGFRMAKVAVSRAPRLPYLGDFLETNVRLYTVDAQDRHGVYFMTCDASRLLTVLAARYGYGVRYVWSRLRLQAEGHHRRYDARRRWPERGLTSRIDLEIGNRAGPSPLEVFLTARWGLHSRLAGRTLWTPNEHPPWELFEAKLRQFDDELVSAAGFDVGDLPDLRPLWSPGVHTTFGLPCTVRS